MHYFCNFLVRVGDTLQSIFLLLMRLIWGSAFVITGYGKFNNIEKVVSFFESLGIVFPLINAYLVAGIELVGGFLLLIGLCSRLSALVLFFTMSVAYLTAHIAAVQQLFVEPELFIKQAPFMFWLTALLIFCFGPGHFSVDFWLKRLCNKDKNKV